MLAVAAAAAESGFNRSFAVQPGATLQVDSYRGNVTVTEADTAEIRVDVVVDANTESDAEAEELRAGLKLEAQQRGNTVSVTGRNPRETGWRITWGEEGHLDLFYRITVPRRCNVDVKVGDGAVTIGSIAGRMRAQIGTGTIFFRRIDGSIEASAGTGDIVVSRCSGAVTARVQRGTIRTGTIGGRAWLKNSTGGIEVLEVKAGLIAEAAAGDITATFARGVSADSRLTTSGGGIHVKIDPAASCRVEASSVWGTVQCRLRLDPDVAATRRHLSGRLNQGGPTLTLHANGGSIMVEPGETLFE